MKKIYLILSILLTIFLLSAEVKDLEYGLGFSAGMISGSGFSFRKLSDDFGYQVNLGALMDRSSGCDDCFPDEYERQLRADDNEDFTDNSKGSTIHANLGFNLYKPLHNGKYTRLYLLAGTAAYFSQEKVSKQDYTYNDVDSVWVKTGKQRDHFDNDLTVNIGAGFGIDYKLIDNIRLSLEWPLVLCFPEDEMKIIMYIPQIGIHYYFK